MRRLAMIAGLACAASALLVGCSPAHGVAELDTERDGRDALPSAVDGQLDGIDRQSTRYLGEKDGIEFYLALSNAEMEPEGSVCLVGVAPDDSSTGLASCGGAGTSWFEADNPRFSMQFVPDGADPELEKGEERLHENLIVRMKG